MYLSTIICPITTNIQPESEILRVHLNKGMANLKKNSDIMDEKVDLLLDKYPDSQFTMMAKNLSTKKDFFLF